MTLKKFQELYSLDVSSYIQKKPVFYKNSDNKFVPVEDKSKWLDYLEWATVIQLLYDNGVTRVKYSSVCNDVGYPAFYNNGKNPFVKVVVEIDEEVYGIEFPVIDGNKVEEQPDQLTIHKAQQRAFVKCVAINTGLGLSLWQKEDNLPDPKGDDKPKAKTLLPFPKDDPDKWKQTVQWLKVARDKDGKTPMQRLKMTYLVDEDTEFNLIVASEVPA